jgi:hypothetical protein
MLHRRQAPLATLASSMVKRRVSMFMAWSRSFRCAARGGAYLTGQRRRARADPRKTSRSSWPGIAKTLRGPGDAASRPRR